MRISLVKHKNINMFAGIQSLFHLKRFKAGSGKTWPDSKILEHNNLPVVKTLKSLSSGQTLVLQSQA